MRGIALCGFMGCGKTTVAKALSAHYELKHIDTDKYIEEKSGMSIKEMFKRFGEDCFRDKEHDAIKSLCKERDLVLALGGGAVQFERNVRALKDNDYMIVFIDTDIDVIKSRLTGDTTRPLLQTNDIDALYQHRLPIYESASDITVKCKNEDGLKVATMIIDKLKKA